jgi:hypothetical protein
MYYKINNILTTIPEYYVPTQEDVANNPHLVCIVGGEQDAQQKVNELKQSYLEQEKWRFTISKETVVGADTTWSTMDEVNDPEDYKYQVFNTLTGLYEQVTSKTTALARIEELKQQLISSLSDAFTVTTLSQLPILRTVLPENTFGPTVGDIPVEVL